MTRRRRAILLGMVVLGSVTLTVGAVEVVGRLLLTPALVRYGSNEALKLQLANPKDLGVVGLYVPHHYYLYATRPSYRSADGRVRHNALGCRAGDIDRDKPAEVYRIITIGGSTTYGTPIRSNEDVHTYRLERQLNEWAGTRRVSRRFEVVNCGVPGSTSAENLVRYIFALSEYRPDLVMIQQGINDVWPRILPRMSRDYREFSKTWDEAVPADNMSFIRRLLRTARNRFTDSVWSQGINYVVRHPFWDRKLSGTDGRHMVENGPEVFAANTRYLVTLARRDGAHVLLLTEHLVVDRAQDWRTMGYSRARATLEQNELLGRLAREEGVLFFDLQAALCACPVIMPDDRHLNEEGERQKAEAIFDYLTRGANVERWLTAIRHAS